MEDEDRQKRLRPTTIEKLVQLEIFLYTIFILNPELDRDNSNEDTIFNNDYYQENVSRWKINMERKDFESLVGRERKRDEKEEERAEIKTK